MASDVVEPINIGSDELVTINQLVDIVEAIAGVRLRRRYKLDAPTGRARPQQRQFARRESAGVVTPRPPRGWPSQDLRMDSRRHE